MTRASPRAWCVALALVPSCSRGDDVAGSSDSDPGSTSSPMSFGDLPPPVEPTTTSGSSSSGGSSGGGEPEGSTTAVAPFCGDHVLDPGEQCDYGRDNSNVGPCTLACTKATCGDGLVWEGLEQCDLGPANAKEYGGCTPGCELAARCGDGNVDPGYEECDQGALNGSGQEVDGDAACSATCRWQGRLVFLSSEAYSGDLGGVSGAELKCQALAAAAGFAEPHVFRAWLSDGVQSPMTRFLELDALDAPYILLDGRIIAASFAELVEQGPRTGISMTETGEHVVGALVWTNTTAFGEPFSLTNHCKSWTSTFDGLPPRLGYNALVAEQGPAFETWMNERHWTSFLGQPCSLSWRLYCFEDG